MKHTVFQLFYVLFGIAIFSTSCKLDSTKRDRSKSISIDSLIQMRYQKMLEYPLDSMAIPRSFTKSNGVTRGVPSRDWTSGFFPGNLWLLYTLTDDKRYKERAMEWTPFIEREKNNGGTHDMGFKVYCSFGEGYKVTQDEHYKDVIVQSAKTLASRFNENVGATRSWDFKADVWEFPVIIDNMMNLELLFEATKLSGDSTFHKMAVRHANTTLENHYRANNSSYHVVVYDTITGMVKEKVTHQGINDESSWARGQAWGIYGFTMTYRYTKDPAHLKRAESAATFYLAHENLPEDGIPFWDFDDPSIPNTYKDVSAATVVASAFYELFGYTKNEKYLDYANKVVNTLKSKAYLLSVDNDSPFILDFSTGNWPEKDELDEPIVYADYYYLEALTRKKKL